MTKEELEKLKDFKVYVFEWEVYVKAEDYKEKAIENKKLNIKVASLEWEIKWLNSVIDKLHKELDECECSFWFESDEVWYRKREYKRLKKWIKDHCKWYWNLFPEDEMKRQWKKADKKRK